MKTPAPVSMTLTALLVICLWGAACGTPERSQRYFRTAVETDSVIEPVYSTSLYTVYYDHALRRCIVHASFVFGQEGSGGGGAGLGISMYKCDPDEIRDRARILGATVFPSRRPTVVDTAPSDNERPTLNQPASLTGESP